jgi:hypothetical protein
MSHSPQPQGNLKETQNVVQAFSLSQDTGADNAILKKPTPTGRNLQ